MEDIKVIKKYLENAKNLEMHIYTQKRIINKLSNKINNLKTSETIFSKPYKPESKNTLKAIISPFITSFLISAIIPTIIIAGWFVYLLISPALTTEEAIIRNIYLSILFALICSIFYTTKIILRNNKIYRDDMKVYKHNLNNYHKSIENEKKRLSEVDQEKKYLLLQIDELNNTLENTKDTLKEFYNSNMLIYPKYQNMLAVTQILEYLQSERCYTLKGPDGAYNLYETELRMNKIIGNLRHILDNLKEIKYTQYMVYEEICRGNEIAERILGEISSSNGMMKQIQVNSAVAAYNSQIAAQNSAIIALNSSYNY